MSNLPAHVAEINGKPLRFFRGPDRVPELPWHAFDDLLTLCGFNREERRYFVRITQRDYGAELRAVMTWSGPVTVAPHYIAQGMIGAAVHVGRARRDTYDLYTRASIVALDTIMSDLPSDEQKDFLFTAIRNSTESRAGPKGGSA